MPCRIKHGRIWTHRIMLEASQYKDNCFVTLTYDDEHLPEDGSVNPEHMRFFLKLLRKKVHPLKIRYYGVGEYGDQTWRPHYHLVLFGFPTCQRGRTLQETNRVCCPTCSLVQRVWKRGHVLLDSVVPASAAYVCGYVAKKATRQYSDNLGTRHPEFARMSLKPGIGYGLMHDVASAIMEHGLEESEDVPIHLRHGSKLWPLGNYLRKNLRRMIGRSEKTPESVLKKMEEELRPMREAAHLNAPPGSKEFAFRGAIMDANEGARINQLARFKRRKGKAL